jgi:hypothetical protein
MRNNLSRSYLPGVNRLAAIEKRHKVQKAYDAGCARGRAELLELQEIDPPRLVFMSNGCGVNLSN